MSSNIQELPIQTTKEGLQELSEHLLKTYFRTQEYPYTRHHIESFDQFLSNDIPAVIKASNPLIMLQDKIVDTNLYRYRAEIYVGGPEGKQIFIGTPSVSLRDSEEVRLLFPNEARLRNLTYSSLVEADIVIRFTFTELNPSGGKPLERVVVLDPSADPVQFAYLARFPLFRTPIMLHSRYCQLHNKPQEFLKEVGECQYDHGGYFVVNGSEKVLITHQEQSFNTLYITPQERDEKISLYAAISCLNPKTRQIKRVSFAIMKGTSTLQVSLPYLRKPIPLFILFRAFGVQSDEDILRLIFPDPEAAETKLLEPMLRESVLEAFPFYDTYSAIQYMKVLTKGYSEAHVLHILYNQTFIHVEHKPRSRPTFLAECVRRILRVKAGIDAPTDKDDIRNQRCLTSGTLCRMLFQDIYSGWSKTTLRTLDKEYKYNPSSYAGDSFMKLFGPEALMPMFNVNYMSDAFMRAFKGKWSAGSGAGVGEEKTGVIQPLSRLSYMDFMSHCRRVVLDFDTGLKLTSPRRLHTSQYGYYCTSETPGGSSIGITKNLSMMTAISTATDPEPFIEWLYARGGVFTCDQVTPQMVSLSVPVFVNGGIVGYTLRPIALRDTLKALKWTGCLPASTSVGFSIRDRRIFVYLDEGRPMRPLIHLGPGGKVPEAALMKADSWRKLVMGVYPKTVGRGIHDSGFVDPFGPDAEDTSLEHYVKTLAPDAGVIEYVDPYEMNEAYVANFQEQVQPETSHLEIHPSTIVGLLTSMIPYANHNQSPRNQLSCSQSKQGLSVYSTAFPLRFDNQVHVLCYGQAPIARTIYYDYLSDGQMAYGHNLILAMGSFTGYNQDDGIVMNADSIERGMFRSTCYRSYEAFEEDDPETSMQTRVANPAKVPGWTSLKPGLDYTKLDDRGIVRVGEMVDETSVLVGRYMQGPNGDMRDASVTAQVWTRGRVDKVAVVLNNLGLMLVKVRVVQERVPELGDKFSNRHGQKGTIGMLIRGYDMPRRRDGIPVDMIMNPHAMPSRMTVAQLLEALVGKAAPALGATANCTLFMNEGSPAEDIGRVLRDKLGMEPLGEELLYDGMSGQFVPSQVFIGNVYTMRLKHMPEDKWNARAEGRREQRTHQPTGGRGAQGGLRIGEMERDAILGHGVADFLRESQMKRSDGYETWICNGCGTIPIYNEKEKLFICSMCDGPVRFIGDSTTTLEILPPNKRSAATFSKVEIPYAFKLLDQELNVYLNMGLRLLTDKNVKKIEPAPLKDLAADQIQGLLQQELQPYIIPEEQTAEVIEEEEPMIPAANVYDLTALGAPVEGEGEEDEADLGGPATAASGPVIPVGVIPAGVAAASNLPTVFLQQPAATAAPVLQPAFQGDMVAANQEMVQEGQLQAGGGQMAPPAMMMAQQPAPVQVQTSQQPVLVVPVNVGGGAAPAEYVNTHIPGAPPLLAVDTSPQAMASTGLPPLPSGSGRSISVSRGGGGGGGGATNRFRSNSGGSSGGGGYDGPSTKITVNKLG